MKPPDAKDYVALIVAVLCIAGLLTWPDATMWFGIAGLSVLFAALARQWRR